MPLLAVAVELAIGKMLANLRFIQGGESDDGNTAGALVTPKRQRGLKTIAARHRYVHDDDMRPPGGPYPDRIFAPVGEPAFNLAGSQIGP